MVSRVLVVVLATAVSGCQSKSSGALDKFATEYSCPEAQVTVTPRTDLDAASVLMPSFDRQPSDEVKGDPARLAKFTADQDEQRTSRVASYSGYEMFEVSGCGHTVIMGCHQPSGRRGNSNGGVICDEAKDEAKRRAKDDKRKAKEDAKAAKRAAKEAERAAP